MSTIRKLFLTVCFICASTAATWLWAKEYRPGWFCEPCITWVDIKWIDVR
jgi:hypothetical protein